MTPIWQFVRPELEVEETSEGNLILRNSAPLSPFPGNLVSWLHQHGRRSPGKPFLQQRDGNNKWEGLTFSETVAAVNQISNNLLALGLDRSAPIAILSKNCIDMALTQLAAMQIGQPVAPISYAYSTRSRTGFHIKHILDVTHAPVLVMCDAAVHMPKISQWDRGRLQLFAFANGERYAGVRPFSELLAGDGTLCDEAQARFAGVTADTLAKIQFTSGSTNLPKGVLVTHGMMASNQAGVAQMWPFLDGDERIVDWLPWNHTFGGNFVSNMALMHGCAFYLDHGNPTPAGLETTAQNIINVSPTIYFSVPRGYTALYARMQTDERLKRAFFRDLKFIFVAAAALDQATYDGMRAMSAEAQGASVPFFSAWGCTETAPCATLVSGRADDIRVIGLPIPGVSIKLAPDPSGKRELRVKGPNVTAGYYNNGAATAVAFDEEGYYRTGDAGAFLDPDEPARGLLFDGRIGENFKLSNGVWVQNAALRASVNRLGQPFLLDIVIAAPNRDYLTALVFPNVAALRGRFPDTAATHTGDDAFLGSTAVVNFFTGIFQQHNAVQTGSSRRFQRFTLLTTPPRIDKNETTDKGYINQQAVLTHRAGLVARLYQEPPAEGVITI